MKTLNIEWRHLDVDGETCDRCYDTGENLHAEVKRLNRKLESEGVKIEWTDTKLNGSALMHSNTILFDGMPMEEILDISVSENYCASCSTLLKQESYCRSVFYDGAEYEDIPAKAIREAVYKVLGLEEQVATEMLLPGSNGGCGCKPGCCGEEEVSAPQENVIAIELLYLDLSVCTRCQGTEEVLDAAFYDVSKVLEASGKKVLVSKVHVRNEELARKYQFLSSPTIRVNGHDIQMEVKESYCESCGDLCGDEVDCRLWDYNGQEYTVPPKSMIVDAILKEVYGAAPYKEEVKEYVLPENLKRFYRTMKEKSGKSHSSCC
ncbi:DUF2703 domain-containing protein [Proteiniclasticum sp. C24MP]|uniref:DUF2703 domain-containing protein n=1 Tax=Proteiniclasticum sp. C24MP TaxID=3374101 RepID=UPI003754C851